MKASFKIPIERGIPLGAVTYLVLTGVAIFVRQAPSFDLNQMIYVLFIGCPLIALAFGLVSKLIRIEFLPSFLIAGIVFSTFLFVQYNETALIYVPVQLALSSVGYSLAGVFQHYLST